MNRGMVLPVPAHQERIPPDEANELPARATDKLLEWLEREDGPVALAVGYGICGVTFIYLIAQLIRVFK